MTNPQPTTAAAPSLWPCAHAVDERRPRSRQRRLGASDTVCERRAAYILAGTAPSDTSDRRAAILGTFIHEGLLGAARTEYGWQVERSVADEAIRGSIDAVQLDRATAARLPAPMRPRMPAPPGGVVVEDVKTKSQNLWDRVRRYGATPAELRQVYTYARLLNTVGFEDRPGQRRLHLLGPLPVAAIRFRFVCRDNGAEHVQEFPFDPVAAEGARWWVERVRELHGPEAARRDFDGPGLDAICDHCPYRSLCWPLAAVPGAPAQTALVHDDQDRAEALADYVRGSEQESEGKKAKKFARARLDSSPAGVYGVNELVWTGDKATTEPDVEAMIDLHEDAGISVPLRPDTDRMVRNLQAAGIAVPERPGTGHTPRAIKVRPAPDPTAEPRARRRPATARTGPTSTPELLSPALGAAAGPTANHPFGLQAELDAHR